jgi:hypothetical protein
MCPFCLMTIGQIVVSAASTLGLAFVQSRIQNGASEIIPTRNEGGTAVRNNPDIRKENSKWVPQTQE